MLAILTLALFSIFLILLIYHLIVNRRSGWPKQYVSELRQYKRKIEAQNIDMQSDEEQLSHLAQLLRRFVTHVQPSDQRGKIAQLNGNDWLDFLDQTFATSYFTQNDGQVFGPALYNGDAKHILHKQSENQQGLSEICTKLESLFIKHAQRSTLQSRRRHMRKQYKN